MHQHKIMQVSGTLSNAIVAGPRVTGLMSQPNATIQGDLVADRTVPGLAFRNPWTFVKTFNVDYNKLATIR